MTATITDAYRVEWFEHQSVPMFLIQCSVQTELSQRHDLSL